MTTLADLRQDLVRIADRVVRDPAVAEDVAQEALLRLQASPEPIVRPDHWLRRVTKRLAIDRVRRPAALPEVEVAVDPEEPSATAFVAAWLPSFVDALEEPYRTAVRRVDLEGITQAQYAAEEGLSLSGARTRVQRGRRLLHEALIACCEVRFAEGDVVDTGCDC